MLSEWWRRHRQSRLRDQLRKRLVRGIGWAVILKDPDGARQALDVWDQVAAARTTDEWEAVWRSYAQFLQMRRITHA